MEMLDKRTLDKMPEDERKQYEKELLKHLPDCSDKCDLVDVEVLMTKISLRGKPEDPQENSQ